MKRLAIFAAVRYNISVNRKFVRGVFAPQIGDIHMKSKPQTKQDPVQIVDAEEKKKAIEGAISQIEKNFGKGAIMRMGEAPELEISAISTGSLTLDLALGIGGVPRGRIVEIYGPESSGKTTVALHVVAETQ